MNRPPRDPRDPFNDPFGHFDPFDDPFFKQFEEIHNHIFGDFFGGDDRPTIFIEHPNSNRSSNDNPNSPDLSQINPNAPPSSKNNNNNNNRSNDHSVPSFFRMFKHFFEPEYDDHKLSDINPSITDNGPIMKNDNDNQGLIHPDGGPPGFRSPYLPNWNGVEKDMEFENNRPKSFYRSQSVIISTGPDGKTRKTTTIRDSNGEETTTTEEYDSNDHHFNDNNHQRNDIRSLFNWNYNKNDNHDNDNKFELFPKKRQHPPLFEQTHDPFERFRSKWQKWRYNPYNYWNGKNQNDETQHNGTGNNEWFWKPRNNDNVNNKNGNEGIKWTKYRDYKSNNDKRPSLLDDIVKNDK